MPTVSTVTAADLWKVGIPMRTGAAFLAALYRVDPNLRIVIDGDATSGGAKVTFANGYSVELGGVAIELTILARNPNGEELWVIVPIGEGAKALKVAPVNDPDDEPIPLDSLTQVLTDRFRELAALSQDDDE